MQEVLATAEPFGTVARDQRHGLRRAIDRRRPLNGAPRAFREQVGMSVPI
jgi:hypothetical protein